MGMMEKTATIKEVIDKYDRIFALQAPDFFLIDLFIVGKIKEL